MHFIRPPIHNHQQLRTTSTERVQNKTERNKTKRNETNERSKECFAFCFHDDVGPLKVGDLKETEEKSSNNANKS